MENNLKQGWVECSLGDILTAKKGKKPASVINEPKEGYVPYILIDEMEGKPIRTYTNDPKVSIIDESEVLLVWDGSIGKCGSGMKGAIGSTLVGLKALDEIQTKFLEYTIKLQNNFIKETSTGSGLQHINKDFFEICKIPLPPLAEQHRIVAKLDALLQKAESNKQRLDKIPKLLKRFRQSVLAAAVSGRLTEEWREINKKENIYKTENKNAEYEWRNLDFPTTWKWDYIKNISQHILGKMLDAAKNKGEPTLYLRNVSVRWFDFDLDTLTEIKATKEDKLRFDIQDGDLFVCEGGEPGRAAVWNKGKNNYIFQKAIHRIRLNEFVNPYWVLYNLKLDADSGNLESLFTGTGIKHLTLKSLSKYPIAIPPIEEQTEIVRRVEQLFAFADKIEARYTKAKTMIDKLPQSILAKAFRGELVAQDPNDEPASVLLERIKLEKEKLAAEKKVKKVKDYSIEETPVKIAAEKKVKYFKGK